MNSKRTRTVVTLAIVAMAAIALTAASANAAITIPADTDHLVEGSVTGTLIVIDVPTLSKTTLDTAAVFTPAVPGGPTWITDPVAGTIAHEADNGFYVQTTVGDQYGISPWEPDGTPYGEAYCYGAYNGTDPEVSYRFNLADCGIDIPDGSVINAIYTTWTTRGKDNADYSWTEGEDANSVNVQFPVAPVDDLILRWYDDTATGHDADFQKIWAEPITVTGGDGFKLDEYRKPNTAHIDAVIIDVTLAATSLLGDTNDDGVVDAADYIALKRNIGTPSGAALADGDFDENGTVDWDDLQVLEANFGKTSAGGAVPEPATLGLLAFGALAIIRRRRRLS